MQHAFPVTHGRASEAMTDRFFSPRVIMSWIPPESRVPFGVPYPPLICPLSLYSKKKIHIFQFRLSDYYSHWIDKKLSGKHGSLKFTVPKLAVWVVTRGWMTASSSPMKRKRLFRCCKEIASSLVELRLVTISMQEWTPDNAKYSKRLTIECKH